MRQPTEGAVEGGWSIHWLDDAFDVEAFAELLCKHLRMSDKDRDCEQVQGGLHAVGIARRRHEGSGFGDILVLGLPPARRLCQVLRRLDDLSPLVGQEGPHRAKAAIGICTARDFHQLLPVSGQEHRPPHARVIEGRLVHMQDQKDLHRFRNVDAPRLALGLALDAQGVFVAVRPNGRPLRGLGLSHLHGRQTAIIVLHNGEDHAVEVWQAFLEVVGVAHVFNGNVRLKLLELPGSRPNQLARLLRLLRRQLLGHVLRVHLHILRGQVLQEQRAGELDRHSDGLGVHHLGALVLIERA